MLQGSRKVTHECKFSLELQHNFGSSASFHVGTIGCGI